MAGRRYNRDSIGQFAAGQGSGQFLSAQGSSRTTKAPNNPTAAASKGTTGSAPNAIQKAQNTYLGSIKKGAKFETEYRNFSKLDTLQRQAGIGNTTTDLKSQLARGYTHASVKRKLKKRFG